MVPPEVRQRGDGAIVGQNLVGHLELSETRQYQLETPRLIIC